MSAEKTVCVWGYTHPTPETAAACSAMHPSAEAKPLRRNGRCAAHGIVDVRRIEGAWRCQVCGDEVVSWVCRPCSGTDLLGPGPSCDCGARTAVPSLAARVREFKAKWHRDLWVRRAYLAMGALEDTNQGRAFSEMRDMLADLAYLLDEAADLAAPLQSETTNAAH